VKYSVLPSVILSIYIAFTVASGQGIIPTGLEMLDSLKENVGDRWFWLVVFCIFLEALVVISLYFPGQYIAALLVILSGPSFADIVLLSFAMVIATTLGSAVNYAIGRFLSKESSTKPISYKTLLPALIHSSGLAIFTFNWGMQRGTAKLIGISAILNTPYYLLIMFTTVTFGEEIIAATDNPLVVGSALGTWLLISIWRDWRNRQSEYQLARVAD
jgi:membrane protein YqaA with SNARE-associated domain